MKKHIPTLLALIACVMLFFCLGELSSLQNQVNQMHNEISSLRSDVNGVTNSVRQTMEEQASILSTQDWSFGELDPETMTVPFTYTVAPKEMSPGVTTAALVTAKETYPLTDRGNGSFGLTLTLPAFEPFETQRVVFETNGTQTTESFFLAETPFHHVKDLPYASFAGSTYPKDGSFHYEGSLHLENCPGNAKFSAELIQMSGSEEVDRQPVEWADFNYHFSVAEIQGAIPYAQDNSASLWVEVADESGLLYRIPVISEMLNEQGEPVFELEEAQTQVYNAQGELLWSGYY